MTKSMQQKVKFKIAGYKFIYQNKRFVNQYGETMTWSDMVWLSLKYSSYKVTLIGD